MLQFLPYAMAAYGGYKGYRGAKESGASGLGRILGGITGAYTGYTLGSTGMSMFPGSAATKAFAASQPAFLANMPGAYNPQQPVSMSRFGEDVARGSYSDQLIAAQNQNRTGGNLLDILKNKETGKYSPGKVSAAIAAATYGLGAFDQQPQDIYSPGYNMGLSLIHI